MSDTYLRAASGKCARLRHKTVQGYENKCGWRIQTDHEHIEHIKVRRILNFDQTNTLSPAIRKSDLPASIERCCPLWLAKPFFIQACRTPINGKRKHGFDHYGDGLLGHKEESSPWVSPKICTEYSTHVCIDRLLVFVHTYIGSTHVVLCTYLYIHTYSTYGVQYKLGKYDGSVCRVSNTAVTAE